jgi:hypothetical protein
MKFRWNLVLSIFLCLIAVGILLAAEKPKTYQVTGPVLEVSDSMMPVQKGKDLWELARDASTKVTGDLKVGSYVTIEYSMTANSVKVKPKPAK